MATPNERIEKMDKYYPDVKSFFKNVQRNGTLYEREKTVGYYVELKYGKHHFVLWHCGNF